MTNHPNRALKRHIPMQWSKMGTNSEEVGLQFVIRSKASGKYLSTKAPFFGSIEDARSFSSRSSAQETLNSYVHMSHRAEFEVVPID